MTVGFATNPLHVEHVAQGHSEEPERIEAALALLRECRLLDRVARIEPRFATEEELLSVHSLRYVEALRRASAEGGGWADMDTYITPRSYDAARQATGACLAATDAVLSGEVRSAFCAVRPPGHHARPEQAMGFCLLNSIAVAAQHAHRRHGLDRVAIFHIEVHHGNGTQDAFYADPAVLYVSTHLYPYYPGSGHLSETGAGEGEGANVNIPLPAGCGDAEHLAAFDQLVGPVVRRFRPHLILASIGFDGHFADPLAFMSLSIAGYGELAGRLRKLAEDLCDGRLLFVLEGGYDLDVMEWGVRRVLEVLLGETPTPDPLGLAPHSRAPDTEPLLAEVRGIHGLD